MRFGKFEIDEWVLYILLIVILIGIVSSIGKGKGRKLVWADENVELI